MWCDLANENSSTQRSLPPGRLRGDGARPSYTWEIAEAFGEARQSMLQPNQGGMLGWPPCLRWCLQLVLTAAPLLNPLS